MSALDHVRRALDLLSLQTEAVDPITLKTTRRFRMCASEDIDRVNGHLPSPWLVGLSHSVREAWEELKMAEADLTPKDSG